MKSKILAKTLPFVVIILIFSSTIQVQASITWEENFGGKSIEDLDDWLFYAWEVENGVPNTSISHGFVVTDGILRAPNYLSWGYKATSYHNSTVAYGTWKFDWIPPTPPATSAFSAYVLMANDNKNNFDLTGIADENFSITGYAIRVAQNVAGQPKGIELHRIGNSSDNGFLALGFASITDYITEPVTFHVIRDQYGHFTVFSNGEVIIEATDNNITTSQKTGLSSWRGDAGIDNIVIDNEVKPPGGSIPASSMGFILWTVTPTLIIITILRKKVVYKNKI